MSTVSVRAWAEAFREGLRESGYVPGENVAIEYRFLESEDEDQADSAAVELVRLPLDLIVTGSTPTTLAAKRATSTIPIVFTQAGDPVGTGLVSSLAHPGGNLTGLSNLGTGLAAKRLELLKSTVPGLTRVAVLTRPGNPQATRALAETMDAAQRLGLQPQVLEVRDPDGLESAFEVAALEHAGAINILGHELFTKYVAPLAELSIQTKLPSMYTAKEFVEAGGLMSYGPDFLAQFRRVAYYVDRILKGAKPADLPVEQPREFDFVVNLPTAQALGLTIPQHVLLQATEVIQ